MPPIADLDADDRFDRARTLREVAEGCFALARVCSSASEREIGEEYLAAAVALENSAAPAEFIEDSNDADSTFSARRRRKPRQPTLAAALKQAAKAHTPVRSASMAPDGTVTIVVGQAEAAADVNPWLAEIEKITKQ